MSRFNELYRGEPTVVMAQLEDQAASEDELRAALINAFQRIATLERQIEERDRHFGRP